MSGAFECATLQYYTGLSINLVTTFDDSSVMHAPHALWSLGSHVRPFGAPAARSVSSDRPRSRETSDSGLLDYRSGLPERTALDGEKLFAIHVHNSSYLTFHI